MKCSNCHYNFKVQHYFCPRCGFDLNALNNEDKISYSNFTNKNTVDRDMDSKNFTNKMEFLKSLKLSIISFLCLIFFGILSFILYELMGNINAINIISTSAMGFVALVCIIYFGTTIYKLFLWLINTKP